MFRRPATEWASVAYDRDAGGEGCGDVAAAQVEPGGEPVDLERDAGFAGGLERALEVEGVLGPVTDQPSGGMAEAAHGRMGHRVRDTSRELPPRRAPQGDMIAFERDAPDFSSSDVMIIPAEGGTPITLLSGAVDPRGGRSDHEEHQLRRLRRLSRAASRVILAVEVVFERVG